MADSLVLGDIELLGGGVPSANPACAGAIFRLLPGYDLGAPDPTTDFVESLLLNGERPVGHRASNRVLALPVWIIGTSRDNLAAAREHLEQTADQDLWTATWARDRGGLPPLPLLIDCFRNAQAQPSYNILLEKQLAMQILVTIPAMPYGRSDTQLELSLAAPVPSGPPAPPAPVVLDNFSTITSPFSYQGSQHVVGPNCVVWDPDDVRVGDPGGQNSNFTYPGTLANSADLSRMTSVSMYLGFGSRYYYRLPYHGRHHVNIELTLTDTAGNSISMSRSNQRMASSAYYQSPVFTRVTMPLLLNDPVFAYTSVAGYTIKVTNHHYLDRHHLRWVTLYLDALTAFPDTQTVTPTVRGNMYVMYGVRGTAPAGMSLELQQPPTAGTPTTVTATGIGGYTVPSGTAYLKVEAVGGGGAGAGRTGSGMGGGGGAGEYARVDTFPAVPAEVIPYSVGTGGTQGATPGDGVQTNFGPGSQSTTVVTAYGGKSAAQNSITGGLGGTGSTNPVNFDGGKGRTASGAFGGGGGSSGGTSLPGNTPLGSLASSFTTVGTTSFVAPAGVTAVYAESWGGGGSAATGYANGNGQGGGGGEYAAGFVPVTPGNSYSVVVGAGGAAVTGSQLNGNNGSQSSFTGDGGSAVVAHGGTKGFPVNNGNSPNNGGSGSVNSVHYTGGSGGPAWNYSGGGGSSASPSGPGNPGDGYGNPGGAPTDGGAGGRGSGATNNNGGAGTQPGGGGGGTYSASATSGAGAAGKVRLTFPGGSPDQFGAPAVAGGGAGGNGGATANTVGSAGSQPGGGGGGANSSGTAEAGGAGGAGKLIVTPYASAAWKSLIVHRPPRGTRSFMPVTPVGAGSDVPNGATFYSVPQPVSGVNAQFRGTYSVYLINTSWNGSGSRTVTVTFRQTEYPGGPTYTAVTPGVTFTPSQITNGILSCGFITLPVRDIPPDNTQASMAVAVTDTNTSDRFADCITLDSMGQTVVLNEPSQGYVRYYLDAPDANATLGRYLGTQTDRSSAVSILGNVDAMSGGPMTVEPTDQDNVLLAYCPDALAPAIGMRYFDSYYFDRTS